MTAAPVYDPVPDLATELGLAPAAVAAAIALFAEGATVPFIARYRKEKTGGLDEVRIWRTGRTPVEIWNAAHR